MEERVVLKLSHQRALHVLRHFEKIDQTAFNTLKEIYTNKDINLAMQMSGSKFLQTIFSSPFDLPFIISKANLIKTINQEYNIAYIYEYPEEIGQDAIAEITALSDLDLAQVKVQKRDIHEVRVLNSEHIPLSNNFVVILDSKKENVITFYPGKYAPAFNDNIKSLEFWNQHVILTKSNL
jgi:hypothetical protein